jgi:2-polyprenyl-6-methoxyphenol hydroxylase-like FAD-dependent oxidoreductase
LARQHAERYVDQRLALIGDAAHVTHPTGAQGMNLAIQDASTLVEQTTPALRAGARDSDLAPALAEYENRRRPINARAIALAHRIARLERSDPITHRAARATLAIGSHVPGVANQLGARLGGT